MSDLISRSELLKRFLVNKDGHRIPERDCDNLEVTVSIKDVKTIIKEQPTAFDIDNVVEELEERKILHERLVEYENKNGTVTEKYQHIKAIDVLNDAIEIVKHGCVSDDVCEWKDKELYGYYTSCTEFRSCIAFKDKYWKYCPYCGKKIKVVE